MDMIFNAVNRDGRSPDVVDNLGYVGMNNRLQGFGEPSFMVFGGEDDMYSQVTIGCGHVCLLDPFQCCDGFDVVEVCQGGI
jgi:hypothetical protein